MKEKKNSPIAEIFSFAGREKQKMVLSTVLSMISVLFGIIPYFAMGKILMLLLQSDTSTGEMVVYSGVIAVALILEKLFSSVSTQMSHRAAYGILYNIRCTLTDKIERTSMGYIEGRASGSFKETIIDLVDRLEDALAHMIPELIPNIIVPLAVIIYLFVLDFRIALVSLISIVVGFIAWGLMLGKDAMNIFRLTQDGNMHMNETIVEYINGMEVIKAYNQTTSSMKKFESAIINYRDVLVKWYRHCHPYLSIYTVVAPATICFELPVSGMLLYHGMISQGKFLICLVLSLGIVGPLMKVVSFSDHINEIFAANTRIQEILNAPELVQVSKLANILDNNINFVDVSFGYGDSEVLHHVSFEVKPGTTTAIVGASGSGKSTIVKLIARFWDVRDGRIEIGGVDVRKIPFSQLMDNLSFVAQENFLADISIRDNIRMGKPDATDEEIYIAARRASCEEFIGRLPQGYDTKVGDAGSILSGGERQRIAIARGIIKDSPIVILDEATASIDSENEYKIGCAINELTRGKTLVIIAHRLSTIKDVDQIIVMEKGNMIAGGTHEQLLENSPIYHSMWNNHIGAEGWSITKEAKLC